MLAELTTELVLQAEIKAKQANPQLDDIIDPSLIPSHLPVVKQSSLVISQEQFEALWQWLPPRYKVDLYQVLETLTLSHLLMNTRSRIP